VRRLLVVSITLALFGLGCQQTPKPASEGASVREGDPAPAFKLASPDAEISLSDYRGEKPVLLYFSMGPG
jgi:hypothetical protein